MIEGTLTIDQYRHRRDLVDDRHHQPRGGDHQESEETLTIDLRPLHPRPHAHQEKIPSLVLHHVSDLTAWKIDGLTKDMTDMCTMEIDTVVGSLTTTTVQDM